MCFKVYKRAKSLIPWILCKHFFLHISNETRWPRFGAESRPTTPAHQAIRNHWAIVVSNSLPADETMSLLSPLCDSRLPPAACCRWRTCPVSAAGRLTTRRQCPVARLEPRLTRRPTGGDWRLVTSRAHYTAKRRRRLKYQRRQVSATAGQCRGDVGHR